MFFRLSSNGKISDSATVILTTLFDEEKYLKNDK